MEIEIKTIDRGQVLNFLGYKNQELEASLLHTLDQAEDQIRGLGPALSLYREFPLSQMTPPSQSARDLLRTSQSILLLAATLGPGVDQWIARESFLDPVKSLIWDATASAAIEGVLETLEYQIKEEKSRVGLFLTDRFSPGYGDLDISYSRDICQILDTNRNIGLSVSHEGLLLPRKSVTAIIGVSNTAQALRERSCENCLMKEECSFRKRGRVCYGKK